jgi:hypothetical protein
MIEPDLLARILADPEYRAYETAKAVAIAKRSEAQLEELDQRTYGSRTQPLTIQVQRIRSKGMAVIRWTVGSCSGQGLETVFLVALEDLVAGLVRSRTRDRPRSSLRRPAAEERTAGARPLPNTPSTASTPPPERGKVLPMCPVRSVTYISGRSRRI